MAYVAVLVVLAWVYKCLVILRKSERAVVLRLGHMTTDWAAPLGPGIKWVWWPADMLIRWNLFDGQQNMLGAQGQMVYGIGGPYSVVRVAGKRWLATSDREILPGRNISVVGVEGASLRVAPGSAPKNEAELLDAEIARTLQLLRLADSAGEHFRLGTLYEKKGDLQAASEQYRIAEKLDPNVRATYESARKSK